jgi:hypothetical protein
VLTAAKRLLTTPAAPPAGGALSPDRFITLTVTNVSELSHDTKAFDVSLPTENSTTGLITSSFILV